MDKKILVFSVSAWNNKVGADTWPMLLSQYEPKNVACVALRDDYPDSEVAEHYFVISESQIIKSIFNRTVATGHRVGEKQTEQEKDNLSSQNKRYSIKKYEAMFRMVRELVWLVGKWKTKELKNFITEFQPDVILYSMEGYIHLNRICRYAKKLTNAKSIGFFWDDNFTYKQSYGIMHQLFRFFQRKSLRRLVRDTDAFWAITNMTKFEADTYFNINCIVLTKPIRTKPKFVEIVPHKPLQILYTGNLWIGRDLSLIKVVNALKKINDERVEFEVHVYTKTVLSQQTLSKLDCSFCHIHAAISQVEVLDLQKKADILLFLEDIDGKDAHVARLSFSTKITDYLCAAKCILAVGCLDTAPMRYFKEYNAAIVVDSEDKILDCLRQLVSNPKQLSEYGRNACQCAIQNHDKEKILSIVDKTIEKVLEEL